MSLEQKKRQFHETYTVLYRCVICGQTTFTPRKRCPICNAAMEYREVKK